MARKLPPYVIRRRNLYYVNMQVPKSLRPILGKAALQQSLCTDSLSEAAILSLPLVAQFKAVIKNAKRGHVPETDELKRLRDALALERSTLPVVVGLGTYTQPREAYLRDMAIDVAETDAEREAVDIEFGSLILLADHLNSWLGALNVKSKTLDHYSRVVSEFTNEFRTNKDVTPVTVTQWVSLAWGKKSNKAIKRDLGAVRGFWKYLSVQIHGDPAVLPNVFAGASSLGHKRTRDHRAFTGSEYHQLLSICADQLISDVMRVAIHSGMRIEEIFQLRLADVQDQVFLVKSSKTKAGRRSIPVHKDITQTVARLQDTSTDGFLVSGQGANKYGQRYSSFSRKFDKLLESESLRGETAFHSFRRSFSTALEANQVPQVEVARLMGHEIGGLSHDLYSSGPAIEVLRQEINKMSW